MRILAYSLSIGSEWGYSLALTLLLSLTLLLLLQTLSLLEALHPLGLLAGLLLVLLELVQ